jgi:hypothetical protein
MPPLPGHAMTKLYGNVEYTLTSIVRIGSELVNLQNVNYTVHEGWLQQLHRHTIQ